MNFGRRAILAGALLATASSLFARNKRLRIFLFDVDGHVMIRGAKVALLDTDDQPIQTVISDVNAQAQFNGLSVGTARFRVEFPGFESWMLAVNVPRNSEISLALVIGPALAVLPRDLPISSDHPVSEESGRVRFRVIDQAGGVVPEAQITLVGRDGKPRQTKTTGADGELTWTGLPVGKNKFRIQRMGFLWLNLTVAVSNGVDVRQAAVLLLPPERIYIR